MTYKLVLTSMLEAMLPETITLFHGTSKENAAKLLQFGWNPNQNLAGGNRGQTKYLYLTDVEENARWFAEEKGESTILEVTVPLSSLKVDPEDAMYDSVYDELVTKKQEVSPNYPAYLVAYRSLPANAFKPVNQAILNDVG